LRDETTTLDNFLLSLQSYHQMIKTKRQLAMEVPAGFCRLRGHQHLFGRNVTLLPHVNDLDTINANITPEVINSSSSSDDLNKNSSSIDTDSLIV
jgi:hypothetical protein